MKFLLLVIVAKIIIAFLVTIALGTFREASAHNLEFALSLSLSDTLFILPFHAASEEALFRLPLAYIVELGTGPWALGILAVLSSLLFGLVHGGVEHIPTQGLGGLIYCIVFLKCGGLSKKYIKALCSSSAAHLGFNWSVMCIALLTS